MGAKISIKPGMHILVVGLGKSGRASITLLQRLGARVSVSEAAPVASLDAKVLGQLATAGVIVEAGGHSPELFTRVDMIVVSPGVPLNLPELAGARKKKIPVIGEIGLAAQFLEQPVVAITGTNGKSTVTTLLGEMVRASGKKAFVGGNLGTPLAEYLIGKQEAEILILEISSFQLDTATGFRPDVGILLNISPDHLDRYESYQDYAFSKMSLFKDQLANDVAILNADDREIMQRLAALPDNRRFYFSSMPTDRPGAYVRGQKVILTNLDGKPGDAENYDLAASHLNAEPNLQNTAAAILAARIIGCSSKGVQKAIHSFKPLPHRLALVAEIGGIKYFDDSKATNIGAVQSALNAMPCRVVLIAGGRDKLGEYRLLDEAVQNKVKSMLLIGEASDRMATAFHDKTAVEKMGSLEEAVERAAEIAVPGEAVLLSPACASFDMFKGYDHRGRVFREKVMAMKSDAGQGNH